MIRRSPSDWALAGSILVTIGIGDTLFQHRPFLLEEINAILGPVDGRIFVQLSCNEIQLPDSGLILLFCAHLRLNCREVTHRIETRLKDPIV